MSIEFAILGILSWKRATGYELKKIFESSSFMHWSGNNNQIYKALIRLKDDGCLTSETVPQEDAPPKKVYTVTPKGLAALKEQALIPPSLPECRKSFLVQLAWADSLSDAELDSLIAAYEKELGLELLTEKEKLRRLKPPGRTAREDLLWDMISKNVTDALSSELAWAKELRRKCFENKKKEDKDKMNYKIIKKNNQKYIELFSAPAPLRTEADALDVVALCGETDTNRLMIHHEVLSGDFFRLKTRAAGGIIQKFVNYRVKAAAIVPADVLDGRFGQWAGESNRGSQFGLFTDRESAEAWLTK